MVQTDGYKLDHRRQMPKEIIFQLNNATPRNTRRKGVKNIVWIGTQYLIKKYLIRNFNDTFFNVAKPIAVANFRRVLDSYLPGNTIGTKHIEDLHDLGYLPIEVRALPEGELIPYGVPPITYFNTNEKFVWLVGYLETLISCVLWQPSTSATTAYEFRKMLTKWAIKTTGNANGVKYQGHDFSMRGMPGPEAAMTSGFGHATSFIGSDTVPVISFAEDFYNANAEREVIIQSVAATEHSVMCLNIGLFIFNKYEGNWERVGDAEFDTFKRIILEVYPKGIVSIVSDTFSLWRVLEEFLPQLKEEILAREGTIVIRPDSGDPVLILTGYVESKDLDHTNWFQLKDGEFYKDALAADYLIKNKLISSTTYTETIGVVESLWNTFGGSISEQGYKLLNPKIGTIYGDGITYERGNAICDRLHRKGFASTNWVAGLGSFTYQYTTRDTDGWAIKATYGEARLEDGTIMEIPVFKDPITGDGSKKSAKGRPSVFRAPEGPYYLKDQCTLEEWEASLHEPVFRNGKILKETSLSVIRSIVDQNLEKELACQES